MTDEKAMFKREGSDIFYRVEECHYEHLGRLYAPGFRKKSCDLDTRKEGESWLEMRIRTADDRLKLWEESLKFVQDIVDYLNNKVKG